MLNFTILKKICNGISSNRIHGKLYVTYVYNVDNSAKISESDLESPVYLTVHRIPVEIGTHTFQLDVV